MDGLRNSGIPLGGLGTGSVELRRDGFFHEWQIMNNAPWGAGPRAELPPDTSYFGLQIHGAPGGTRSVILGIPRGFNHNLNDPYGMPWIEHPAAIEAQTRVPFTRLAYDLGRIPLGVELEAFSPFIPLDAENSGLPIAFFTFSLRNRTGRRLGVSLFQAMRNLVGYCEPRKRSTMRFAGGRRISSILFGRKGLSMKCPGRGSMALGVWGTRGATSFVFHSRSPREIWEPLRAAGGLESCDCGSFRGKLGDVGAERPAQLRLGLPFGVLCRAVEIAPRGSAEVTFALAWHFPRMRERDYSPRGRGGGQIGHRYAGRFAGAGEVLDYGARRFGFLREESRLFTEAYHRSSFPAWLLSAVSAQLTTLVKSSWHDARGRFGIWEGLGCCGLQTMDITHYGSFPIVQMFPEIQKSQMILSRDNSERPGKIPHMMPGTFSCPDVDHRNRIDLIPQFILLVWRDALWTGDVEYVRRMRPAVEAALDLFETFDTDGDGLPNNRGPDQTYDQFPLSGTSSFVGFLYAAALLAAESLEEMLGRPEKARRLRSRREEALGKLDAQLWTGAYWRLSHDGTHGEDNDGVMADQANGDWFVRQTTGRGLLPDARVRRALGAILKHCARPRGYVANCVWPRESEAVSIGRHTADQANWPWSGVEYALAAHMVLCGMEREGLKVARGAWERYERAGLRFNHIECGEHYYRAMSSWAVYLALTGFAMDAVEGEMSLRVRREPAAFVVCAPSGWGEARTSPRGELLRLAMRRGRLLLRRLLLQGICAREATADVDGRRAGCSTEWADGRLRIVFDKPVRLSPGETLRISSRRPRG